MSPTAYKVLASGRSVPFVTPKSGGWVAITEIEDLFGHEPLSSRTRWFLHRLADDALTAGRYDFHMGGKLQGYLEQAGVSVSRLLALPDQELSFQGAATPEVVNAWQRRFQRMPHLQALCASEFSECSGGVPLLLISPRSRLDGRGHFLHRGEDGLVPHRWATWKCDFGRVQ